MTTAMSSAPDGQPPVEPPALEREAAWEAYLAGATEQVHGWDWDAGYDAGRAALAARYEGLVAVADRVVGLYFVGAHPDIEDLRAALAALKDAEASAGA